VLNNVWFDLAPWLAFFAGLVGFYLWMRRPPRPARVPRQPPTPGPSQRDREPVAGPDGGETRPS
jgi:hypothetical protein